MKTNLLNTLASFILLIYACDNSPDSFTTIGEMQAWMQNPENGLVKSRSVGALTLELQYLPPEFLAYKELILDRITPSKSLKDSVLALYKDNMTFLLTIDADEEQYPNTNLLYTDIGSYQEYSARVNELNFRLADYIELNSNEQSYVPVLANFENTYGLDKALRMTVVFNGPLIFKDSDLDFVFSDEFFGSGINHFRFNGKILDNIPKLTFFRDNR